MEEKEKKEEIIKENLNNAETEPKKESNDLDEKTQQMKLFILHLSQKKK